MKQYAEHLPEWFNSEVITTYKGYISSESSDGEIFDEVADLNAAAWIVRKILSDRGYTEAEIYEVFDDNPILSPSEEDQEKIIEAVNKYGSRKWFYYEYPQCVIDYLEDKKISRDQADGYAQSYKGGRRTLAQIRSQLEKTYISVMRAASKVYANEHEKKILHERKRSRK